MAKSIKVSIPLEKLQDVAFFHEDDTLLLTSSDERDDLFNSLFERAETFVSETAAKRKVQQEEASTSQMPTATKDALAMPEYDDYEAYEEKSRKRVFRHQRRSAGHPRDPRPKPAAGSPSNIVQLKAIERYPGDLRPVTVKGPHLASAPMGPPVIGKKRKTRRGRRKGKGLATTAGEPSKRAEMFP